MATAEASAATINSKPKPYLETPQEPGVLPEGYWERFAERNAAKREKWARTLGSFQMGGAEESRRFNLILEAERLTFNGKVVATFKFIGGSAIEGLCLGLTKYHDTKPNYSQNSVIVHDPIEGYVTTHDIGEIETITTKPGAYDV